MTCLFCKIARKEIPAIVVFEDDDILAFRDVNPQAPTHILVIPKTHIGSLNDANAAHEPLLGHMLVTAKKLADAEQFSAAGYRVVCNTNSDGGQTVQHIHLHIMAGRKMTWPPG